MSAIALNKAFRVVAPCGGSGGVSIIDSLLDITPNVISVTGVHDNGGHSGEIRSSLGLLPPGDATHQIAVHIRDREVRYLFLHRWKIAGDSQLNGHRPGNDLLATAEYGKKSHYEGVKLLEKAFKAWYLGRVIPISDDNIHIRICLADGTLRDGEVSVDSLQISDPPITDIEYIPGPPRPIPEAIEQTANAELVLITPGTLWGTHIPILRVPGFRDAVIANRAPIAWFCNAVTTPETHGYTTSHFAEKLVHELGREIDLAFINFPKHNIPKNYETEGSYPVQDDLQEGRFVKEIYRGPYTKLESIEGKLVIRHNGITACQALLQALSEHSA